MAHSTFSYYLEQLRRLKVKVHGTVENQPRCGHCMPQRWIEDLDVRGKKHSAPHLNADVAVRDHAATMHALQPQDTCHGVAF